MVTKRTDFGTTGKQQVTGTRIGAPEDVNKLAKPDDLRRRAIRNLLEEAPVDLNAKLVTVKTAHHVDKDRFQSALRSLMGTFKP